MHISEVLSALSVFTNLTNIGELTLHKIHVELTWIPINSSYIDSENVLLCAHKIPCPDYTIDLFYVQYDSSLHMLISRLD